MFFSLGVFSGFSVTLLVGAQLRVAPDHRFAFGFGYLVGLVSFSQKVMISP